MVVKEVDVKNSKLGMQYKVRSVKKVRNISVETNYFENSRQKSFMITIRVFAKRDKLIKSVHWFEIYGSTQNSKYNRVSKRIKNDESVAIMPGSDDYKVFDGVYKVVVGEFDDYTKNAVLTAMRLIDGSCNINQTPDFIVDEIAKYNEVYSISK